MEPLLPARRTPANLHTCRLGTRFLSLPQRLLLMRKRMRKIDDKINAERANITLASAPLLPGDISFLNKKQFIADRTGTRIIPRKINPSQPGMIWGCPRGSLDMTLIKASEQLNPIINIALAKVMCQVNLGRLKTSPGVSHRPSSLNSVMYLPQLLSCPTSCFLGSLAL